MDNAHKQKICDLIMSIDNEKLLIFLEKFIESAIRRWHKQKG